jgi:hypothetical protein
VKKSDPVALGRLLLVGAATAAASDLVTVSIACKST